MDRSPTTSARRSLRRISWRSFLSSVARYSSQSPLGEVMTGQTSSCSRRDVPAACAARSQGRIPAPAGPGRRSAAGAGRRRPMVGRRGRRRAAGEVSRPDAAATAAGRLGGQDRGVVGVVAGAEEDGLGIGGTRPAFGAVVALAQDRPVAMSSGSTSWRCISGTIARTSCQSIGPTEPSAATHTRYCSCAESP